MQKKTTQNDFELGQIAKFLIILTACFSFFLGLWILLFPNSYHDFSGIGPAHLLNEEKAWGSFGIIAGLFYIGFVFMNKRIPGLATFLTLLNITACFLIAYLFFQGPLTGAALVLQGLGYVTGVIGFGRAMIESYRYGQKLKVAQNYFSGGKIGPILEEYKAQNGQTLGALNREMPILLVFLRHFGCTFCREALVDVGQNRNEIEAAGIQILLVHMVSDVLAARHLVQYPKLEGVLRISDPEKRLYAAFELQKGTFGQLYGIKTWVEGFRAGLLEGNGIGPEIGDSSQMPGIFLLHNGEIKRGFRHFSPADRPDYCYTADCLESQEAS